MKKISIFLLSIGLLSLMLHPGTFYVLKDGRKVAAGTFNSQKEFVQILKKNLTTEEQLQEELAAAYGLMFLIMPAPKNSIERVVAKRILDFYNYPEKYDFIQEETTGLYGSKKELLKSEELKLQTKNHGEYEVFIIGIDVKNERMHSISKANGTRIFLDSWYSGN